MDGDVKHVVVVFTDAGGGHRASAEALKLVLEGQGGYRVSLVNAYREVLPHLDLFARFTGRTVEGVYNDLILGEGRTGLFCWGFYACAVANVGLLAGAGRRAFADLWQRTQPDIVISVLPLINPLMIGSLKGYRDGNVPFAILMTDWAELSRHVWFPGSRDYDAICGTEDARRAAGKRLPPERVHALDGLLIRPAFMEPLPEDVPARRQAAGLDPDRPTVLTMYGGHAGPRMAELAAAIAARDLGVQVVFLCGRNTDLAARLEAARLPYPHKIVGYTDGVADLMALADVFVGKAGPQSVSEAVAMGLPVLIDGHRALPQERALTRWVDRSGMGATFTTVDGFVSKLDTVVRSPRTRAQREAARTNASARQIGGIVSALLSRGDGRPPE